MSYSIINERPNRQENKDKWSGGAATVHQWSLTCGFAAGSQPNRLAADTGPVRCEVCRAVPIYRSAFAATKLISCLATEATGCDKRAEGFTQQRRRPGVQLAAMLCNQTRRCLDKKNSTSAQQSAWLHQPNNRVKFMLHRWRHLANYVENNLISSKFARWRFYYNKKRLKCPTV